MEGSERTPRSEPTTSLAFSSMSSSAMRLVWGHRLVALSIGRSVDLFPLYEPVRIAGRAGSAFPAAAVVLPRQQRMHGAHPTRLERARALRAVFLGRLSVQGMRFISIAHALGCRRGRQVGFLARVVRRGGLFGISRRHVLSSADHGSSAQRNGSEVKSMPRALSARSRCCRSVAACGWRVDLPHQNERTALGSAPWAVVSRPEPDRLKNLFRRLGHLVHLERLL